MFCLMSGLPPFAVGVTAKGTITKKDFEMTLVPALQNVLREWKGINLLLVLDTKLKDFTIGAWLQDIKVNATYFLKWNKLAVVTDAKSMEKLTGLFSAILPGEAKTFSFEQLNDAKEWIAEP